MDRQFLIRFWLFLVWILDYWSLVLLGIRRLKKQKKTLYLYLLYVHPKQIIIYFDNFLILQHHTIQILIWSFDYFFLSLQVTLTINDIFVNVNLTQLAVIHCTIYMGVYIQILDTIFILFIKMNFYSLNYMIKKINDIFFREKIIYFYTMLIINVLINISKWNYIIAFWIYSVLF